MFLFTIQRMFTRILDIILSPFTLVGGVVSKSLLWVVNVIKAIFQSRGRTRVRLVLLALVLVVFFVGNLDYPRYWNNTADWINPKLDAVDVPSSIERFDRWEVFRTLDEKIYIKHFWDRPYSLGLDLQGGIHLVYEADLSSIGRPDQAEAMAALRDVIERRVNILGVAEPVVQVQRGDEGSRLIIELAGITDPDEAVAAIGETPFLDFKELRPVSEQASMLQVMFADANEEYAQQFCTAPNSTIIFTFMQTYNQDPCFVTTGLTGQYLQSASVQQDPTSGILQVGLQFNSEGADLFEEVTARNVGRIVAIYLDDLAVSYPTVRSTISGGQASISGNFTTEEARSLARNLNAGALPVPISLISQQRVGASLGERSLNASVEAAMLGIIAVLIFLILVYRFSGFLAVLSLAAYIIFLLAFIKLIPITLTLAGIAGFILSIGMAVDANVLVFERFREELRHNDRDIMRAVDNAFSRAWPSIRDGNISTLLTAAILFWFSTSFVKGFALTLGIGILMSMFSSMIITKYLIKFFIVTKLGRFRIMWTR